MSVLLTNKCSSSPFSEKHIHRLPKSELRSLTLSCHENKWSLTAFKAQSRSLNNNFASTLSAVSVVLIFVSNSWQEGRKCGTIPLKDP